MRSGSSSSSCSCCRPITRGWGSASPSWPTPWACGTPLTPTTSPRSTTPPARCWANVRAPVSRVRSGSVSSSPSGIPPSWSRSGRHHRRGKDGLLRGAEQQLGPGAVRGLFGTVVSASFLFSIGLLNLVILAGIVRVFTSMRRGTYDEAELERQLANRGFFYGFFGRWMRAITKEWQMYPVGVVFGLGFDTATEVALLATTALLASQHIPWYAIVCLPILFTAGMTVMDTTDGLFMSLAYGWAFFNPRPEGVLQPGHHRAVRGDLLLHRRHRGPQPAPAGDRRAQPDHRLLGPDVQLQPQHGRVRHRGHVPPHLAGRAAHLAVRPDRGTMDRQSAARPGGERPTLTTQGPEQEAATT